jgi:hypothetical protein
MFISIRAFLHPLNRAAGLRHQSSSVSPQRPYSPNLIARLKTVI